MQALFGEDSDLFQDNRPWGDRSDDGRDDRDDDRDENDELIPWYDDMEEETESVTPLLLDHTPPRPTNWHLEAQKRVLSVQKDYVVAESQLRAAREALAHVCTTDGASKKDDYSSMKWIDWLTNHAEVLENDFTKRFPERLNGRRVGTGLFKAASNLAEADRVSREEKRSVKKKRSRDRRLTPKQPTTPWTLLPPPPPPPPPPPRPVGWTPLERDRRLIPRQSTTPWTPLPPRVGQWRPRVEEMQW